jgi:hypothetical protein
MAKHLPNDQLDHILSLQLAVAWAGEAAGEPARLGWWKSDLVDREGGGDLFERLAPRTAPWASLILVRDAARRVDFLALEPLGKADQLATLFHLGAALDQELTDRLHFHRHQQHDRAAVFPDAFFARPWSRESFETLLGALGQPKVELTPGGRCVSAKGATPVELAHLLAAALLPLAPKYPMPYAEVGG